MSTTCFNEVDPVCGMVLDNCKANYTEEFGSKTYGFCSAKCKEMFHGNPKKYIENPAARKGMPAPKQVPEKH
jgi:Cu+-exporting ATPase